MTFRCRWTKRVIAVGQGADVDIEEAMRFLEHNAAGSCEECGYLLEADWSTGTGLTQEVVECWWIGFRAMQTVGDDEPKTVEDLLGRTAGDIEAREAEVDQLADALAEFPASVRAKIVQRVRNGVPPGEVN